MRKDEFNQIRQRAIASYMEALKDVGPVNAPRWLLTLGIIPVFLWEALKVTGRFFIGMLVIVTSAIVATAIAPFLGLYALFDTLWVMAWFFARILDKMTGEQP